MGDIRFDNEIKHLLRLKQILDYDKVLPLRFNIQRKSLNFRLFEISINGITSLVENPEKSTKFQSSTFNTTWNIPVGYPWTAIPYIIFSKPIPFHPHVFNSGGICWGSISTAQPDYTLADWFRCVIEYLVLNKNTLIRINSSSPANQEATHWWMRNLKELSSYVSTIDMARLRYWVDRTRG